MKGAGRAASVPVIFSNQDEGAPGPSLLGTGDVSTSSNRRLLEYARDV